MITSVIAILITPAETLSEIIVVIGLSDVVAVVAVVCVLIGIRVLISGRIAVLPCGLSGLISLRISIVHCLPKRVRAVLVGLVVAATAIVAIDGSCVVIRIVVIVP